VGEELDGFAQAHVVGEDAAEGVFAKELEPGEAVELVGAEGGVQSGGGREAGDALIGGQAAGEGAEFLSALPLAQAGEIDEFGGPEARDPEAIADEGGGVVEFGEGFGDVQDALGGELDEAAVGEFEVDGFGDLGLRFQMFQLVEDITDHGQEVDGLAVNEDAQFEGEPVVNGGVGGGLGVQSWTVANW